MDQDLAQYLRALPALLLLQLGGCASLEQSAVGRTDFQDGAPESIPTQSSG
jgi:hypothetical protein